MKKRGDLLPSETKLTAVSEKKGQRLIKTITAGERNRVIESCLARGWSYPIFYQPTFTSYNNQKK